MNLDVKKFYYIQIKIRAAQSLPLCGMPDDCEEHGVGFLVAGNVLFLDLDLGDECVYFLKIY